MPCDQVRKVAVEVGTMDLDVLERGLRAIGAEVQRYGTKTSNPWMQVHINGESVEFKAGKIVGYGQVNEALPSLFKKAYAAEVVKTAAKKFGWAVKQAPGQQFKFSATRGGF